MNRLSSIASGLAATQIVLIAINEIGITNLNWWQQLIPLWFGLVLFGLIFWGYWIILKNGGKP